jgi:DNA polymerase-3 subunit epsilon
MKNFFLEKLYNSDESVVIRKFSELPAGLFEQNIEMTADMGICSILDTETTGLVAGKDEIIEIAIRQWIYHKKEHYLIKPVAFYAELNEPKNNEISDLITEITGITKEDVAGKKIDWESVAKMLGESDFILAHNAGFDRPMIEEIPMLKQISANKIWTCSFKQVDWAGMGFLSAKQELLSVFHGFHYSGHRALTDIDALANLMLQGDYLKSILASAKTKQVNVDCISAPFDKKDLLKSKGFFWDAPNKCWSKLIPETEQPEMKAFLTDDVYPVGRMKAEFSPMLLRDRFKAL